jgi:hypothetical protein
VNRGPDVPLAWKFHEDIRIPPELDGDVRFEDVAGTDVGADRDGRIYVLDRPGGRVLVFGRQGRLVGSVGGPEAGSTGLAEPIALGVSADGEVAVYDSGTGIVRRWGASGEMPPERLEAPFVGPALAVASWGIVYPSRGPEESDARIVRLAVRGTTRTGFLVEVKRPVASASFPSCGGTSRPMPPIFSPELRWSLGRDELAAAAGPEYEIRVFDRGVLVRTVTRDVPPLPASRELALRAVGAGLELTTPVRCLVPPAEVLQVRGFAPVVPTISGLAVAPDGSVWVRRAVVRGEEDPAIDILRPDGGYLGTLPPGSPFPAAFAGRAGDYRVVSIATPDRRVTEVLVSRIERKTATSPGRGSQGGSS